MNDPKKVSEDLVVKVRAFLMQVACDEIAAADEPDLLTDAEVSAFTGRVIHELSLDLRVGLHAEVWVEDVGEYARKLARNAINAKLQKAASAGHARSAGREF